MSIRVKKVIGRRECLKCGYLIQVEGHSVDRTLYLLEGYQECRKVIEYGNEEKETIYCGNTTFTESKMEIVARKEDK